MVHLQHIYQVRVLVFYNIFRTARLPGKCADHFAGPKLDSTVESNMVENNCHLELWNTSPRILSSTDI